MSDVDRARRFADALQELERTQDVAGFVADVFAAEIELSRPETDQLERGTDGAQRFWQQYVDQFEQVGSEFTRVVDADTGVLEWTSRGRLRTGADIDYRGVSLLDFDTDGRVTRFATYYDTAAFTVSSRPPVAPAG